MVIILNKDKNISLKINYKNGLYVSHVIKNDISQLAKIEKFNFKQFKKYMKKLYKSL